MNTLGGISRICFLAAAAVLAGSSIAEAGCVPSVEGSGTNTCIGQDALVSNNVHSNTAIGSKALYANTEGTYNTAVGLEALYSNDYGYLNVAMGVMALKNNSSGAANSGFGNYALFNNTNGASNVAFGQSALFNNGTGGSNTGVGGNALYNNTTGSDNTALGYQAGSSLSSGNRNIAIGAYAGKNQIGGNDNIAIGAHGASADSGVIRIGRKDKQTATFIAGIRGAAVTGGLPVLVKPNGQLGVATSSARYEQDIQPMGGASSALMQLRPVTYRHRQAEEDGSRPLQYGLMAEDVAKVIPDLAVYDESGAPEAVAYQLLPSLLLNEYQKQNARLTAAEAKLDAAEKKLSASEDRLAAMEAQMAAMQEALSKVASAAGGKLRFASAGQ